jgi:hypothetical protein
LNVEPGDSNGQERPLIASQEWGRVGGLFACRIGVHMAADDREWLSPAQAARMLDVTPDRVRQLMRSGQLAYQQTPIGRLTTLTAVRDLRERRERARAVVAVPV